MAAKVTVCNSPGPCNKHPQPESYLPDESGEWSICCTPLPTWDGDLKRWDVSASGETQYPTSGCQISALLNVDDGCVVAIDVSAESRSWSAVAGPSTYREFWIRQGNIVSSRGILLWRGQHKYIRHRPLFTHVVFDDMSSKQVHTGVTVDRQTVSKYSFVNCTEDLAAGRKSLFYH